LSGAPVHHFDDQTHSHLIHSLYFALYYTCCLLEETRTSHESAGISLSDLRLSWKCHQTVLCSFPCCAFRGPIGAACWAQRGSADVFAPLIAIQDLNGTIQKINDSVTDKRFSKQDAEETGSVTDCITQNELAALNLGECARFVQS
jgi:hypothetical protein